MFNELRKIWSRVIGIEKRLASSEMIPISEVSVLPSRGKSGIIYLYNNDLYIWNGSTFINKTTFYEVVKVGEVDYEDFNKTLARRLTVILEDAKPANKMLFNTFLKIAIPFEEDYYSNDGNVIVSMNASEVYVSNTDNPSIELRDIQVDITLSDNNQDWVAGRIDVYALLMTYPTL